MNVSKEHLNYVPGIVAGLGMAINCFTSPGDKIMIMPPVYHPFAWLVKRNNRQLVECPLILEDGHYRMNLDQLRREKKGVRVLILCNPHNPVGRVWSKEELETIANICIENNITIISDEIYSDIMLWGNKHTPMASISEEIRKHTINLYFFN